ncbi:hypothetical protein CI102_4984 [Trichoderma harzianum]|nr:hypothetical protein CI102_4984 [Trichoderma harzianum]
MQMQMQMVGHAATKRPAQDRRQFPPRSESVQRFSGRRAELRRRAPVNVRLLFASKLRFAVPIMYLNPDHADVPFNIRHAGTSQTPDNKGIHNKQAGGTQNPQPGHPYGCR